MSFPVSAPRQAASCPGLTEFWHSKGMPVLSGDAELLSSLRTSDSTTRALVGHCVEYTGWGHAKRGIGLLA